MDKEEVKVRVALRIRPLSEKEKHDNCAECLKVVGDGQVRIENSENEFPFTYDCVFDTNTTQKAVYTQGIQHMLDSFFAGYNVTVFAYGQTGTGKTYTMGTGDSYDQPGVIPRVADDVFGRIKNHRMEALQRGEDRVFTTKVQYLEIYKENFRDLLCPTTTGIKMQDGKGKSGPTVTPLETPIVTDKNMLMEYLLEGNTQRRTGDTKMNQLSSRSHSIFTLIMEQKVVNPDGSTSSEDTLVSKFHLVDLAGSERQKKTGAIGERFKESVNINAGLLALGNVISALADTQQKRDRNKHIPYRASKLTRILQDSLGGNSHTLIIACVSPADNSFDETVSTLRYANRARNIKNKPHINRDPATERMQQLLSELQMCKALLRRNNIDTSDIANGSLDLITTDEVDNEEMCRLRQENMELTADVADLQANLSMLTREGQEKNAQADLIQQLQAQLANKTTRVQQLEHHCGALEGEIRKRDAQINVLQTDVEEMEKDLTDAATALEEKDQLHLNVEKLQFELQQRDTKLHELQRDVEEGESDLINAAKSIEEKDLRLDELSRMLDETRAHLARTTREKNDQVENLISTLEQLKRQQAQQNKQVAPVQAPPSLLICDDDAPKISIKGLTGDNCNDGATSTKYHDDQTTSGSSDPVSMLDRREREVKQLGKRVGELEEALQQRDAQRDIIIDTKLKRMQDLVIRLHTANKNLQHATHTAFQENAELKSVLTDLMQNKKKKKDVPPHLKRGTPDPAELISISMKASATTAQ
eukprot:TRINITY_DN55479_c0_g1_i1.p1 TRINITY_DN55479_c0_g1~~TRINITY_DN55479_c0_g1_i1.p1  ORF type:complete len:762 (+),score=72.49 TRINITY_DN55479_c0_g1_i1:37-2322(+)